MFSCGTQLNYLGDSYSPTTKPIDVFYDLGDIPKDFRVIGKLSGQNQGLRTLEQIKQDMIKEAQKRGAEGILFLHFDSFEMKHDVAANLIVYK